MQCVFRVRRRFNYNFSLVFYAGADIDAKAVADAGEMLCVPLRINTVVIFVFVLLITSVYDFK